MGNVDQQTTDRPRDAQASLIGAIEELATARSMEAVVDVLRRTARAAIGAEGIAVVIREEGRCFYAAEDAIGPLWGGSRFPESACISGWAMARLETVAIPDIRLDERVPQEAYAATFVRSVIMAPIGSPRPIAALGAYWSDARDHDADTVRRLESLARLAAIAIENARLLRMAEENSRQKALMVAAGHMGMWSFDVATGILETSALCRINFGRDPALPFSYGDLHAAIHADDKARVIEAIETSLRTGGEYDIEHRLVTPAGETRWIGIRAQPSYGPDGRPTTLDGLSVDITERKRMEEASRSSAATLEHLVAERTRELVETQEALRQAQKLEAMGQLTGGVAHDFNNLLTPIIGSLDMLVRRGVGNEREKRLIDGALQSADRAKILVQRLLAFARRQPLQPTAVDLAGVVKGMAGLLESTLGPQITVRVEMTPNLPPAVADPNQLEMALLNLAVNSRDAMPIGGALTIGATRESVRAGHRTQLGHGHYVRLFVRDTGQGMDEATKARAVEPFFSTKGVGKGTGLGLSMVHGLVAQLGGGLLIDSARGRGTTIELWLPVSLAAAVPDDDVEPARTGLRHRGTALLVDDEDLVRMSTADMLIDLGFEVEEVASAEDARRRIEQGHAPDIVVTDHLMPGMTGADLARHLRAVRPELPVLIVSGYAEVEGIAADTPRLTKPFRNADLAASLAALIPAFSH